MDDPSALHAAVREEVGSVLVGNEELVERLSVALLTRGHVLLEGVPGVAKTTVANLFARAIGLEYSRIQLTPDVLPADITGTHVYREGTGEFDLQRGPVFANVVVADEINRATPKTQSALLEAMQEAQVTIEDETLPLPAPFMVIATQNPIEMEGVWELPEAQRDRFQLKLAVDLPAHDEEREILDRFDADPELGPGSVEPVVTAEDVLGARRTVASVYVDEQLKEYILAIVEAVRADPDVAYGPSPRASIAFLNTAKALAALDGRDYAIPDDVKALVGPILVHRIVPSTDAELSDVSTAEIVERAAAAVEPPGTPDASGYRADPEAGSEREPPVASNGGPPGDVVEDESEDG